MKHQLMLGMFLAALVAANRAEAQTVNWTIDGHQNVSVGGISGRTGVGAAVFGSNMYVVFTPTNDPYGDSYNDNYMHILSTNGSAITSDQRLNVLTGAGISDANPAVTATGTTNINPPYLYVAANSQQPAGYGGYTGVFRSSDGVNFYLAPQPPIYVSTDYSPSLTTDPFTNDVYLGVRNAADQTLTLCRLAASNDIWSCANFPGTRQMGYNPALAFWNGVLYVGFVELDNAHKLRMFTSYDQGQTISEPTDIANSDASSSNPSLVVYNNALYVGFRSNDSAHNFLYKYSTNGINYTQSFTTNNTRLGGAPMMVNGAGLLYNSNWLWNWNSANDSTNWLWHEHAQ